MAVETTYTDARQGLARLLDRVTNDREVVLIRRRGRSTAALLAADELSSLMETAHLMRSPNNARRLLAALRRAYAGGGRGLSMAGLKREIGIGG